MIDIDNLIKQAIKARNSNEMRAFKNLKAEIQTFKTAKNAKLYDEAAELQLINKMCKRLEDAIFEFSEARRDDLVSEYRSELEILQKLLPEPVNESQICSFIESDENFFDKFYVTLEHFSEDGSRYTHMVIQIPKKEMGNSIKYLKSKFPTADGKMISEIIKKYII